MTHTHTYALLDVTEEAYNEILVRLERAGYGDQIHHGEIDMNGLALVKEGEAERRNREAERRDREWEREWE